MTTLLRRVENLEAQAAVSDGDGGGFAPLTVEVWADEGVDAAEATARAVREAAGRSILPLPGGIYTVVVVKSRY